MPGTPRVSNGSVSISSGFVLRRRRELALVVVGVVGNAHAHAARGGVAQGAGHDVPGLARQAHVVEGEVERLARLAEEVRHAPGHLDGGLPLGVQGVQVDHAARR